MSEKELSLLKEEERALVLLHTKLSDQLNRLKVEELALSSMLRLKNRPASSTLSQLTDHTDDSKKEIQSEISQLETKYQETLDLTVRAAGYVDDDVEEEEEEEDNEPETVTDQLSAFLDELSARKQ